MTGSRRREEIVSKIKSSEVPVPGKELAKVYDVSRQVIVQDIALIRAAGYDIISTNRGYILNAPHTVTRVFKVSHTDEQMEDELYSLRHRFSHIKKIVSQISETCQGVFDTR